MLNVIKNKKIIIICILLSVTIVFYYYKNIINQNEINTVEENLEINTKEEKIEQSNKRTIKVHITGAVNNEGVVELESESRLSDAIDKAGGLKANADLDNINLACILEDGIKIYIPKLEDKNKIQANDISSGEIKQSVDTNYFIGTQINQSNQNSSIKSNNKKVNINTATQDELETLPGVGESTAKKIINYRSEVGKFKEIDDIKKVSGIGEAKFKKIKEFITIK